jgi:hypothetical protein
MCADKTTATTTVASMITFALQGPLGGMVDHDATTVHAITSSTGIAEHPGPYMAPCGESVLPVVTRIDGVERVLVWPIRARGPMVRCRECWVATGSKRPRRG